MVTTRSGRHRLVQSSSSSSSCIITRSIAVSMDNCGQRKTGARRQQQSNLLLHGTSEPLSSEGNGGDDPSVDHLESTSADEAEHSASARLAAVSSSAPLSRLRAFTEVQCLGVFWLANAALFAIMVSTRSRGLEGSAPWPLLRQVLAGGLAAALAETIFYPTEVVKVRIQLASSEKGGAGGGVAGGGESSGVLGTLRTVFREQGLAGLWAPGIVAGCMRGLVYQGMRLGLFTPIKEALYAFGSEAEAGVGVGLARKLLAGMLTGMVGAGICSPFDLAKVLMTADGAKTKGVNGAASYANSLDALVTVARREGVWGGLWRASGVSMVRAAVASGAQLATYDYAKTAIAAGSAIPTTSPVVHLVASLFAALAYTTASAPLDLVKSRVMAQGSNLSKRRGAIATAADVLRNEGVLNFWRGWWAATLRLMPIVVFVFPLMEQLRILLGVGTF
jgi:hypothetical protein